ncbi:MAG: Hpt domain-containing protein [Halobacteriovoraceae bacterium]|nr:Hpt domain-containing protein [Halobacteriovoraceae bacterium]
MTKFVVRVDIDLEDLIPGFLENRRKDIETFQKQLSENDVDGIKALAHKIAGNAGGYGFDGLGEMGAKIENLAKNGDISNVPSIIEEMQDYLDNVEVEFEEID